MASTDVNIVGVIQAEKGEFKNILVRFRDRNKQAVDISSGWTFAAVAYNHTTRLFSKSLPGEFDLSGGSSGELRIPTDFATPGRWKLQLTATRASPLAVLKPVWTIVITEEKIPAAV